MLHRFWCIATNRSISSSDWAGQLFGDDGDSGPADGLDDDFGEAVFSSLRLPMIGDFPASGELTPSANIRMEMQN